LKKGVDKSTPLCYNNYRKKEREVNKMINETRYVNKTTGEYTLSQKEAMEWYRNGDEIAVITWSETLQDLVTRVEWVH
jgi:hypothetical protein